MFINFNDISKTNGLVQTKKGLELRGGITPIRIIATLISVIIITNISKKSFDKTRFESESNRYKKFHLSLI